MLEDIELRLIGELTKVLGHIKGFELHKIAPTFKPICGHLSLPLLLPYFLWNVSIVCELEQKMQSETGFNDFVPLSGTLIIS